MKFSSEKQKFVIVSIILIAFIASGIGILNSGIIWITFI